MSNIQEIAQKLLERYEIKRFKPSYGVSKEETFARYNPRDVSTAHQVLFFSGLLEKRASGRSDATYRLTPMGLAARQAALKEAV